jgi:hypothetical protein
MQPRLDHALAYRSQRQPNLRLCPQHETESVLVSEDVA